MKKRAISIAISFLLILFFTNYCKSPASSDAPLPFSASKSDSNSTKSSNSSVGTSGGLFKLILKDKPIEDAKEIWITINKIRIHKASKENFIVVSEEKQEFDLLVLKDSPQAIVEAELDAGHYNQIRMAVISGRLVFDEDDEVGYELKVSSNEIKIPVQFEVEQDGKVQIILDFDAEKSIHVNKKGKKDSYSLRPVIKVVGVSYS